MLASVISQEIQCGAVSTAISPEASEYGYISMTGLIVLFSFREIMSASKLWDKTLETSLDMGIFPLLYALFAVTVFKMAEYLR
jgi:hypothetical protein